MKGFRSPGVLVVGAGPAGLATAIACAQRGYEVVVLERRNLPIDKACGEGLMPDAVEHLTALGVRPPGCSLEGIRYSDGVHEVYGAFVGAAPKDNGQAGRVQTGGAQGLGSCPRLGLGVRRTDLSEALHRRAEQAGVSLRVGDGCLAVRSEQGRNARERRFLVDSRSGSWSPGIVVGADGLHSQVREQAGLDRPPRMFGSKVRRLGVRRHFRQRLQPSAAVSQKSSRVEVFWARGTEAYVTPVGGGVFGVALLFSRSVGQEVPNAGVSRGPERVSVFERHLGKFPELQERLAGCEAVSRVRGAGPLRRRVRRHAVGNLALVGDAGGYVDAITGEGLAIAFAEANLLAQSLPGTPADTKGGAVGADQDGAEICAALRRYHLEASRRRRVPEILTEGALVLSRWPWLRSRFLRALARQPRTFERVLSLHTRASSDFAALPLAVELSWRLALG